MYTLLHANISVSAHSMYLPCASLQAGCHREAAHHPAGGEPGMHDVVPGVAVPPLYQAASSGQQGSGGHVESAAC